MDSENSSWSAGCAKPIIFPGRISHVRLNPRRHRFAYSYLMVRVPVGWTGCSGSFLSVDSPRSWLHVDGTDHLSRGRHPHGLQGKLKQYLLQQGVPDPEAEYPNAVLVAAPRVLGYVFNPASFWYLYDDSHVLKAMIVEVNNTFGERRMYFLRDGKEVNVETVNAGNEDDTLADIDDVVASEPLFRATWAKDFHVSPFNSRLGSYSLVSTSPINSCDTTSPPTFDAKLTLLNSDARPKLTARAWSTSPPLDPTAMSLAHKLFFFASWSWVGLVTFPRIIIEATALFFTHKLHVWYRPEVRTTTMGREPSAEEIILEGVFRTYLRGLALENRAGVNVKYTAAEGCHATDAPRTETFPHRKQPHNEAAKPAQLSFHVLTPAFYARLASHTDMATALLHETLDPAEQNRTASVSDPALLSTLTTNANIHLSKTPPSAPDKPPQPYWSPILSLSWTLVRILRVPPPAMSYPYPAISRPGPAPPKPADENAQHSDEQRGAMGALDVYVRQTCSAPQQAVYCWTLTKLFCAERFAFGFVGLLRVYAVALAVGMAALAWRFVARG